MTALIIPKSKAAFTLDELLAIFDVESRALRNRIYWRGRRGRARLYWRAHVEAYLAELNPEGVPQLWDVQTWLDTGKAATYLMTTPQNLRQHRARGTGSPYMRITMGVVRYSTDALEAFQSGRTERCEDDNSDKGIDMLIDRNAAHCLASE